MINRPPGALLDVGKGVAGGDTGTMAGIHPPEGSRGPAGLWSPCWEGSIWFS